MYQYIALVIVLAIVLVYYFVRYLRNDNVFTTYTYLDYNATAPLKSVVLKAMLAAAYLGNPSSAYAMSARHAMEGAERAIRAWTRSPDYFLLHTSGASESNSTILWGVVNEYYLKAGPAAPKPHLVVGAAEHKSLVDTARRIMALGRADLTLVLPNGQGIVEPEHLAEVVKANTILVSVMHVNNELGSINAIRDIAAFCRGRKIFYHVDATQSFGKYRLLPQAWGIGGLTASWHKYGGPPGLGLLMIDHPIVPQVEGAQNHGMRGGTENVMGVAGILPCIDDFAYQRCEKNARLLQLRDRLVRLISMDFIIGNYSEYQGKPADFVPPRTSIKPPQDREIVFLGPTSFRVPNRDCAPHMVTFALVKYRPPMVCNRQLQQMLLSDRVAVSTGSACNGGKPSHVLEAIGAPNIICSGVLRVSWGDESSEMDIDRFYTSFKQRALTL